MGLEREFFLPVDLEVDARNRCRGAGDDWEASNEAERNKWRLVAACEHIGHLRSLVGAVADGPTAAETLAPLRHKSPDA